jgi:hypothetical protein
LLVAGARVGVEARAVVAAAGVEPMKVSERAKKDSVFMISGDVNLSAVS